MKRRVIFQVVSSAVMLTGLGAALLLCNQLITRERAEILRTTTSEVDQIAVGLKTGLLANFEHLERLGRWWLSQGKPLSTEDWQSDGQLFLSRSAGLRQASWVGVDNFQHWSAEKGAEPSVRKTLPDPRVQPLIEAARVRRAPAISDVFAAADIPAGVYVCIPVIEKGRLRGYVVGLYDVSVLVLSLARSVLRPDQRISLIAAGREIYSVPSGRFPPAEECVTARLELPNQVWTVALGVSFRYFHEFRESILTVVSVIGALIYSFGMLLLLSQRRSSELERANAALEKEVSRRTQAESEVRHRIADFQTLLDVIPIGIAVADDPACRSIRLNPALSAMLGIPDVHDVSTAERLPCRMFRNGKELRPEDLPMQVAASTGGKVSGEEQQIVRADGSVIDVLSFASPVLDENGRVRAVLNALVDISGRKVEEQLRRELERRLQRAQRMQSLAVMAGGIAHRFNNLLTSVIGRSALALDAVGHPAEARFHLTDAMKSAHEAADLIHQVLAYTGMLYHTVRPIDLAEVANQMQPCLTGLAGPKARIRFDRASPLPRVLAAVDEVQDVLKQLVLNAAEAMEGRGAIDIRIDTCELSGNETGLAGQDERLAPGTYVRVKVSDTGPGMPAEIAEKAFDPFFSTKFQGRGLGLSVVLGVMRAHKGAVRLKSAPNAGTSVELFFPAPGRNAGAARPAA